MIGSDLRRRASAAAIAFAVVTIPTLAHAETNEQKAVTLFERARKLARDGHCDAAIPLLLDSVMYSEGVGPLLNLGNCYETTGKIASAYRWFSRAEDVATARNDKRRDEAAQRAHALAADVPTLVIHVPASLRADAVVKVDGEPWPKQSWNVPAPIDPGAHRIDVEAPPDEKHSDVVTVRGKGDHAEWTAPEPKAEAPPAPKASLFVLSPPRAEPAPPPPSSTQRSAGLVVGGAGALGVVAGAVFGVLSIGAHNDVLALCATYPRCAATDRAALDSANSRAETMGTVSTIAFVAGAALLAGGAALFFSAPSRR